MTLSGLGNRDKPSASWFCEPGRCVIVKLYPCNWINIRCSLGGADAMGLLAIITRGRWSVMTFRPFSQRLDRCDRVIQKESGDPNGGNMCSFSGATGTSRVRHNAHYGPYAQIRFDL